MLNSLLFPHFLGTDRAMTKFCIVHFSTERARMKYWKYVWRKTNLINDESFFQWDTKDLNEKLAQK